ncbi:WbqC family protein [soil metagenome]
MTTVVISQPMLFPWVGMFEQIALADVYVHYDDVQFSKGSFTNRVQLKGPAGPTWLTIPLDKSQKRPVIGELRDAGGDWRVRHHDQVAGALRGAPHLDEALAALDQEYRDPDRPLAELLMGSMETIATRLGVAGDTTVLRSSDLGIGGSSWERVLALVRELGGDTYVTGHGASRYLDAVAFEAAGVEVRYMDYAATPYPQLHGAFTPYVSILDLVANVGGEAPAFLVPRTVHWRDFAP